LPEGPPLALATWRYDFQYELQLNYNWNSNDELNIVTPSGAPFGFLLNSDGSTSPITSPSYGSPQSDYAVSFQGTLPSDLTTLPNASTTWILTTPDDTTWTIQTFLDPRTSKYTVGRPVSMTRRDGQAWTFAYGSNGQLTSITDSYGNQITFDWLIQDNTAYGGAALPAAISKAHLPGGYTIAYGYTDLTGGSVSTPQTDQLTNVQYLDPSNVLQDQISYVYGDAAYPTFITAILDANGVQRWGVTYDANGNATSSFGPGGDENYSVAYGAFGSTFTRTVTSPLGKVSTYTFQSGASNAGLIGVSSAASTNSPASSSSLTYGSDGYVASTTDDNGNVTTYTHDPRGMPAQVTEASGTSSARTTTTTWDGTRRVPTRIVAPGLTTAITYDAPGGGGGGGGGGVSSAHRYWRVQITDNGGAAGGQDYSNFAEVQMYTGAGTAGLLSSSSTISSSAASSSYPATNAVDGDPTTTVSLVSTPPPPFANMYWQVDFGAGGDQAVNAVSIMAWTTPAGAPVSFHVDWSADGVTWRTGWTISNQRNWGGDENRLFVNPSYSYTGSFWGAHKYWRAWPGGHAYGNWSAAELQFRSTPGGSDTLGSATLSASSQFNTTYGVPKAHDSNPSTAWVSSSGAVGGWYEAQYGTAVALGEIVWTARNDGYSGESPTGATMQFSDDGTHWANAWGWHYSAWPNGGSATFTDPTYH
jgi:YD repeat-containing protein